MYVIRLPLNYIVQADLKLKLLLRLPSSLDYRLELPGPAELNLLT